MVAIFGLIGACEVSEMAAIGRRLGHHGNAELIWSPDPDATLGLRARAVDATSPTVPLVFAGLIYNRIELSQLVQFGTDRWSDAELLWQLYQALPIAEGLLADVGPVAPGGWVRLRSDGWEARTYTPLQLDLQAEKSEDDLAGELREVLLAATRRLIEGVSPVGIALSAGLDSTVTLGAVRAVAPDVPIHTFTASFHPDDS
jgi:asparagine synthetase B (glutamine-hydrolysing)